MRNVLANEKLLRRIEYANGAWLAAASLGAWGFFSAKIAFGVFLGAAIASLSFQALKWQLQRAFHNPSKPPPKGGLFISYYLRFLMTLFVVFAVIYYGWVNPIALVVGLSVVVWSIAMVGAGEFIRMLVKKGGE